MNMKNPILILKLNGLRYCLSEAKIQFTQDPWKLNVMILVVLVYPLTIEYSGAWIFYFGGVSFVFKISNSKITIEGKPITLVSSDNAIYPNSAGWMKFNRGSILYYIKFGPTKFDVVAFENGEKITGTVIKQIPSYSKIPYYIFLYLLSTHYLIPDATPILIKMKRMLGHSSHDFLCDFCEFCEFREFVEFFILRKSVVSTTLQP